MNREIKFRVWVKNHMEMGDIYASSNRVIGFADHNPYDIELDVTPNGNDIVLMQYTGLLDKDGKEIYEGDIVRSWRSKNDTEPWLDKVVWDKKTATYQMVGDSNTDLFWYSARERPSLDTCEVIGNIYENPELLNKEIRKENR